MRKYCPCCKEQTIHYTHKERRLDDGTVLGVFLLDAPQCKPCTDGIPWAHSEDMRYCEEADNEET